MWILPFYFIITGLIIYLTAATLYILVLAVAYFVVKEPETVKSTKLNRFAILIPSHNEELLISRLCESLLKINYPRNFREIFIIADNCSDRTVEICYSYPVNVLIRNDPAHMGKGFALSWSLEQIVLERFDAVLIVDADSVVDSFILYELNQSINRGEQAIQCYNSAGNRNDSWFTQLLFVSHTVGNLLYQHSKYKMGLSSYLDGDGMCFKTTLLQGKGWTAFTIGEDWEYYAELIEARVKIGFAVKAKVYHQESLSLGQATSQRLRWSSGRFAVLKQLGFKLFFRGLGRLDWWTLDASLPLILPNYSLQINLTVLTLIMCLFMPYSAFRNFSLNLVLTLICGQFILFLIGVCLSGECWNVFKATLYAPLFLGWKLVIDFLSLTRIYRGDKWIRTERHLSRTKNDIL